MSTRTNINGSSEEARSAWQRIKHWIETNIPSWANGPRPLFEPPATQESLSELETHLKIKLPGELQTLLLTNNGCRPRDYPLPMKQTMSTKWRTVSTREIAEHWDLLSSVADENPFQHTVRAVGPVRAVWWDRNWIPIAEGGMGDVVCADMNPEKGGSQGQLVLYEHDFEERKVLYPSLVDWLRECADAFERGDYVYVEGVGLNSARPANGS